MRRRVDLVVPIRDRRRRRRVATLRNAGYVSLALIVIFLAISLRSEMRGRGAPNYGRPVSQPAPGPREATVEVVEESPPPAPSLDPMLVPEPPPSLPPPAPVAADGDVAIVGGPEGLTIVQRPRQRPVLSGGFGRPAEPR